MRTTIVIALILAVLRIIIGATNNPEAFAWVQVFKDIAHLFMGGLCVAMVLQKKRWQTMLFWSMNALEVAVAVLSRM